MSKIAILFPGQGAQGVGMGKALSEERAGARSLFERANDVLGFDLASICFEGPIEELTKSSNTQPGIFVVSLAAQEALDEEVSSLSVSHAAGLSSGEWSALYLAGVLSFEDTLRVLQARGRYMQEACEENPGGMLSVIGLERPAVEKVAKEAGIQVANINSPLQIVLSGKKERVAVAEKLAKEAGAKMAVPLNVAGAFHSDLMSSAAEKLAAFLADIPFHSASFPVLSNVTGEPHGAPESIRKLMVEQVTSAVQWVADVETMRKQGVEVMVECGPGKVLSGLVKRIDKGAALHNIQDPTTLAATVAALTTTA